MEKDSQPVLEEGKLQCIRKKTIQKFGLYAVYSKCINITLTGLEEIVNGLEGVVFTSFSFAANDSEVGLIYISFKDGTCLLEAKDVLENSEISGKDKALFDCYLETDFYKKFTEKRKLKILMETAEKFHNQHATNPNDFISIEAELKGSSFEESGQRPRVRKRPSAEDSGPDPSRAPRLNELAENFKSVQIQEDKRQKGRHHPNSQQYFCHHPVQVQPGYPCLPFQPASMQDPSFYYQLQQQLVYSPPPQQGYYQYPNQVVLPTPMPYVQRQRGRDSESPTENDSVKFERDSRLYVTFDKPFTGEEHVLRDAFKLAAPEFEYISKLGVKTFAFVKYRTSAKAREAMGKLHDTILAGRHLKITIAQPPRSTKRQKTAGESEDEKELEE